MAPGRILQIFFRLAIQNQIRITQRVSSSTQPVSMLKWQALSSYFMCDFCDTSLLIRFWTHSRREEPELVGAMPLHLACARPLCRLKAPLGLSLLRNRGILLSEENKNPNPSPIEKRFGFSILEVVLPVDIPTGWEPRTNKSPTGAFVAPPQVGPCCSSSLIRCCS